MTSEIRSLERDNAIRTVSGLYVDLLSGPLMIVRQLDLIPFTTATISGSNFGKYCTLTLVTEEIADQLRTVNGKSYSGFRNVDIQGYTVDALMNLAPDKTTGKPGGEIEIGDALLRVVRRIEFQSESHDLRLSGVMANVRLGEQIKLGDSVKLLGK